ncbi:ACP S-malonyltransferase [Desulfatitalea alkaliphila]|uniref:Malonyl CoA-acyl carrier protein transacylase n=1 Tax=Desulfatitalea alkaliphila TaxID=2929485 RepID=A0AA41R8N5_9BACT|nr:ACP S-malonyltransferase [Desulfatitalea alkaliphila]MCJ8503036.1 ACP S-malonyltransferase [Desulfatitalea alkaliphila]
MKEAVGAHKETTVSNPETGELKRVSARTAFMFPGQGTQYLGMGKHVCDHSPRSTAVWDCASDISGINVRKLCSKGPMKLLDQTRYQQIAITTVNMASLVELTHYSPMAADAVLGHSVGEYTALYCAGAIGMEDTFRAVNARARIMQQISSNSEGGMAAVIGPSHTEMQELLEGSDMATHISIANDNTPQQQVLAGPRRQLKTFCRSLMRLGHKVVQLPVNGAWHSSMMAPGVDAFATVLTGIPLHYPKIPVIMNRAGRPVSDPDLIRRYLSEHLSRKVLWAESMRLLVKIGVHQIVEIGPRKILSRMLSDFVFPQTITVSHIDDIFRRRSISLSKRMER